MRKDKKLSLKNRKKYLQEWLKKIANEENDVFLRRHIIKHVKEIFEGNDDKWIASVKNLIAIFELKYNLKNNIDLQLERLENKYNKNPKRYTDPPNINNFTNK